MKKLLKKIIDVIFIITLTLLGKSNEDSFALSSYQIVVTIFWITGILKFMECETTIKDEFFDNMKDLFIAIAVIPSWYWMSGHIESDLYEPLSILIHYVFLMLIVFITYKSVKLSGKIAYYTHAAIPLIAVLLIRLGMPIVGAVVIAVILPEPVNYIFFVKKHKK